MPGRCPALCPSNNVLLADTLLARPDTADTSVRGYVSALETSFLLASTLDSLRSLVLMRVSGVKVDSFRLPGDTNPVPVSSIDSVQLTVQVLHKDTAVKQVRLLVYRLPARYDSTMSYVQALPLFADSMLVDSTDTLPDSLAGGAATLKLPLTLVPAPGDSGLVGLGFSVAAPVPTAVGLGSGVSGTGTTSATLHYFLSGKRATDTTMQHQSLNVAVASGSATFLLAHTQGQPPVGELDVGGVPAARAMMRLALPSVAIDSNAIVRATLVLTLARPVLGLPSDSFYLVGRPILRDLGLKSLLYPDSTVTGAVQVHVGDTARVEMDITPLLRLWGTTTGDSLPRIIVLRLLSEGATLGEADFKGQAAGAAGGPRLQVTYVKRFTFGVP